MSVRYSSQSVIAVSRGPRGSRAIPFCQRSTTPVFTPNTTTSSTFWSVTSGSTAHTAGSWGVANSSTFTVPSRFDLIVCNVPLIAASATDSAMLLDIGTGSAGSEVAIASGIAVGGSVGSINFPIPVACPANTRVVVRARGARTSLTFNSQLFFFDTGSFASTPTAVDVIGTSTANSGGTPMSGASGTYVEITSSTSKDYQCLILVASLAAGTTNNASATTNYLSLAVGAAGSERILSDLQIFLQTGTNPSLGYGAPTAGYNLSQPVRAGSRISVRHNIAANPERVAACVIGVPYV